MCSVVYGISLLELTKDGFKTWTLCTSTKTGLSNSTLKTKKIKIQTFSALTLSVYTLDSTYSVEEK